MSKYVKYKWFTVQEEVKQYKKSRNRYRPGIYKDVCVCV